MPFDGLTVHRLCLELTNLFANSRIDKIHQPEKDEIILTVRSPGCGSSRLLISANARWARMHITGRKIVNPPNPPAFCMLLRKHLEGGKIKRISQVDFDRIVHIEIEALDEFREWRPRILICEFMGKHSNIILVNPESNNIIDAIKKYNSEVSSFREVLPGKTYLRPPEQGKLNPLEASYDDFADLMYRGGENIELARSLFRCFSGFSPFSCRESCVQAGLDPDMPLEHCGEYELSTLYQQIKKLLQQLREPLLQSEVVYKQNYPLEFAPYPIHSLAVGKRECFNSIMEACQSYFDARIDIARLDSAKANVYKHIRDILDKFWRKKFFQEGDLKQAQENERYRLWGELLTAYAYRIEKGQKTVSLEDFYSGEKVDIELDPRLNAIQNAQRFFKIYNKSTKTIKHLETLMSRNQNEIDYLESVLVAIEQAESPLDLEEITEELEKEHYFKGKTKKGKASITHSQPRRYISSDGYPILVGRNNRQNDFLTIKQAEKNDLWLHTKEVPGTHVIVKLPPRITSIHEVPDATLLEAAALAAHFSKASEADKVAVDYTFRSNVKKPGGSRPGMVVYESYWTVMVNPRSIDPERLLASPEPT